MKLSTRMTYGSRALLDLALHNDGQPVSLKDVAKRQQISLAYLEHLIAPLVTSGIVKSARGPKGGILLTRPPREIRLSEIMAVLEGSGSLVNCLNGVRACPRSGLCATQDVWKEISIAINNVLESTTLQDLVERQKSKTHAPMYYI